MKNFFLLLTIAGCIGFLSCNSTKSTMPDMSVNEMQDFFKSEEGQDQLETVLKENKGSLQSKAIDFLQNDSDTKAMVMDFMEANPGAKDNLIEYVFNNPELKNQLIGWVTSNPDIMKKAMSFIGM